MTKPRATVATWIEALPEGATSERVREGFWYVRIPGVARRIIPIEIEVDERSTKLTSHVIVEPDEDQVTVYRLLLRRNHAGGPAFSIDGREGVICLVERVDNDDLTVDRLDAVVGQICQTTEETFRSILGIGFASRLRR